jgi:hypothetical protein
MKKDCHLCPYENRNNWQKPCRECLQSDCRVWGEEEKLKISEEDLWCKDEWYGNIYTCPNCKKRYYLEKF